MASEGWRQRRRSREGEDVGRSRAATRATGGVARRRRDAKPTIPSSARSFVVVVVVEAFAPVGCEGKKKYLSAAARPSRSRVARRTKSPIHSVDPPASSAPPFSTISPAVPRARVNAARASLAMGRAPDAGSLVGLNTFIRGPRAIARFASTTGRGARARFVLRRDDATPCARRYDASGTTIRRGRAMRVSRVRVPRAGMPRAVIVHPVSRRYSKRVLRARDEIVRANSQTASDVVDRSAPRATIDDDK